MSRAPILALVACACWGVSPQADELAAAHRDLAACVAGATTPAGPDLEVVAGWLTGMGDTPSRAGGVLSLSRVADGHPYAITVQLDENRHVAYLATSGLMSLHDTSGDGGVVSLLTNMAALNYEHMEGKLQLNPASGEVVLSIELETDDGLGRQTFEAAVRTLTTQAETLRPKLIGAATSAEL